MTVEVPPPPPSPYSIPSLVLSQYHLQLLLHDHQRLHDLFASMFRLSRPYALLTVSTGSKSTSSKSVSTTSVTLPVSPMKTVPEPFNYIRTIAFRDAWWVITSISSITFTICVLCCTWLVNLNCRCTIKCYNISDI